MIPESSQKPIYVTFAALLALLVATVAVSFVPLGIANTYLAMAIAVCKLMLVVVVFMNLRRSSGTIRLAAAAGVLWLSFAMVCVLADYHTRGWGEADGDIVEQVEPTTPSAATR